MTTPEIPAERIVDGHGLQIVNVFNREGEFVRQLRHRGTEEQARAEARRGFMHPTTPGYADTVAVVQGWDTATRQAFAATVARLHGK
ncbi:hypothetical protein GCM10017559_08310 [Streptosporangium longisporum]|uniref:Uncharacterized protein n=1 Tax=Streptosporangium longisporum TaxID=46187 RepID=A0ABN3XRL2_9ACTN